jgi:hypothetical protein
MTKISAGSMFALKRVFPILWFGFLVLLVGGLMIWAIARGPQASDLFFLVTPAIMAVIGYMVMRRFIWDLVDEVYDHGDYLVIRNRGDEARVNLTDVMNVNVSTNLNPPRITLRLVQPSKFGTEIAFSPIRPFIASPFAKNEVAESLIVRVDRARSKRSL